MNQSKKLSLASIFLVAVVGAFFFGWSQGSHAVNDQSLVTELSNKDEGKPTNVDFAPFWKAWNVINEKFAGTTTDDQDKVYGAISGMTASLGDPYTVFFPPKESEIFATEIAGKFEGVGMEVGVRDGHLAVVAPIKDSPADKAGVKAGDFILKINDEDATAMTTDAAVNLIRGKAGTEVRLTLGRDGVKTPIEVSITRAKIDMPTVTTVTKAESGSASGGTGLRKDGVFVISLYSFSENSAYLFRQALKSFVDSGSHKLIVDLRGNPGGYLDAAIDMASWFLPSGKVVVREDFGKGREETVYRSKGYDIFTDKLRMIILVDGGSASASEILSGALSENGRAKLVGTKTFGKGSVQELVNITPDTSLKVTIAKWLTPNGNSISKLGITPDYVVERTEADFKAQRDPQMDKAVELLSAEP
ncbi:MAG TPA: S41 family peptidase [Candidatus Paceibacterota bacterium]|jgi:carboxyl-terminal processing protease|nr:S41 family peptidase [Candidatus Paceibacterota bacterium]